MASNSHARPVSSDLTFITNEAGQSLRDRFAILLGKDTRFFDCLVGYFFISPLFFQSTRAQQMHHALMPREVILSSWVVSEADIKGGRA